MNTKKKFFIISMPIIMAICSLFLICDYVDAAPRTAVRANTTARKSTAIKNTTTQQQKIEQPSMDSTITEPEISDEEPELIIENKSNQFEDVVSAVMETATEDNSFAEMIRKQRAALAASESSTSLKSSMKSGQNSCDSGLRTCMIQTCGSDFSKCALDGDTIFGDKLNRCRNTTQCTGEEFKLFTAEIKADRDMNVKLASYNAVLNCGNSYNACIMNECGTTYTKCLGKSAADVAIQKCSTIARDCMESDSGLASRFGTVIGKLRENAEKDIKKDEERLYKLRDLMAKECTSLGAMFDERTFDCVYTINFFAGDNQTTPMASRKRYAGDTFVCMQEWFGVNTTTYKENAYRETRAQTGASSAMLGSGVGTAVGLFTSGAINRALDTQAAKKALDAAKNPTGAAKDLLKDGIKDVKEITDEVKPISDDIAEHTKKHQDNIEQGTETVADGVAMYVTKGASAQTTVEKNKIKKEIELNKILAGQDAPEKEEPEEKIDVSKTQKAKQPSSAEIQQQLESLEFSNQIHPSKETTQRIAILRKMYEDTKKKEDGAQAIINQAADNAGLNIPLGK